MNRKALRLVLQIAICSCLGCGQPSSGRPKTPGELGRAEVEEKVKENLNWEELHLTEDSKRKYSGSGTSMGGERYNITVTQDDDELRWTFDDGKGNGGTGMVGWKGN